MAFSSRITAELSLDSTSFTTGLQAAERRAKESASIFEQQAAAQAQYAAQYNAEMTAMQDKVGKSAQESFAAFAEQGAVAGEAAGSELAEHLESGAKRKLLHGLLDGVLMGVGLGSVDKLVEVIDKGWKDAADDAERLAAASEKAVEAQKRWIDYLRSKMPLEEQIKAAQGDIDTLNSRATAIRQQNARQSKLENEAPDIFSDEKDTDGKTGRELIEERESLQRGANDRGVEMIRIQAQQYVAAQKLDELQVRLAERKKEEDRRTEEALNKTARQIAENDKAEQTGLDETMKKIGEKLRLEQEAADKKAKQMAEAAAAAERQKEAEQRAEEAAAHRLAENAVAVYERAAAMYNALRDQSGATVGEVLEGKRGSPTDRAQLQEAERLRRQAERIRDGGSGDYRDASGQITDRVTAANNLEDRANQITNSTGILKSSELVSAFKEAFGKSEEHLAAIKASLQPTSPPSGST